MLLPPDVPDPVLEQSSGQSKVARSGDQDLDSMLQQTQLNGTDRNFGCTNHPTWFRSWTDHMHAKFYEQACINAWHKLIHAEGISHANDKVEFLSEYGSPSTPPWAGMSMRTPLRFVGST